MKPHTLPLALAALGLLALPAPGLAASAWSWSALPGEESRSQITCSTAGNDDSWVCLALRCEGAAGIALYAELTNLALDDRFDLVFADRRITVRGQAHDPALPYSHRIDGPIEDIIAAMRDNPAVTIDRPAAPINPDMATIPLAGASAAIAAVEAICASDTASRTPSDGAGATAGGPAPAWTLIDDGRWCSVSRRGEADASTKAALATPRGSDLVYLRLTYPAGSFVDDADIVLSADLPGGVTEFTAKATGDAIADLDHAVPDDILARFAAAERVDISATPPGKSVSVKMAGLAAALTDLSSCAEAPRKK